MRPILCFTVARLIALPLRCCTPSTKATQQSQHPEEPKRGGSRPFSASVSRLVMTRDSLRESIRAASRITSNVEITEGAVASFLFADNPGAVKLLAQWTEEFSDILCEKSGLLHGGKVAAPGHDSPAQDIVAALCERARRKRNILGEEGHRHGNLYAVCGRKLKRLLSCFIIQAR